ncbi:MAG TPA: hypothetical protein VK213_01270 [Bacteroidales bacterium]|nr:hypothetical protein [Bacteroidales bacterium]
MELASNIRLRIGKSLLKKKALKVCRKVSYNGFDRVRRIAVVWDASNSNEFNNLSKFHQKMNDRNIEVKVLGYFPGKNMPDQYTAIRYLTCLRRNDVNFFYIPNSGESDHFINDRFDILIDMNFENLLPLKYLSSMSQAAFKIGLSEDEKNNDIFDMMMEMKKPVDAGDFLEQTMYYLEMIKS